MYLYIVKSVLSIMMLFLAIAAMFTMFEVFGRDVNKYNRKKLTRFHKIIGRVYFLVFAVVAFLCIRFIVLSGADLSPRGAIHTASAITIVVLMGIKLAFIRAYKKYYGYAQAIGIVIAVITFIMVGTSGGYYLLASGFGTDTVFDKKKMSERRQMQNTTAETVVTISMDPESIERGRELFDARCRFCHYTTDTGTKVGPGLKDILKRPLLPASERRAVPENIIRQLRRPLNKMPSFEYLSEKETGDLLAYLNTL